MLIFSESIQSKALGVFGFIRLAAVDLRWSRAIRLGRILLFGNVDNSFRRDSRQREPALSTKRQ